MWVERTSQMCAPTGIRSLLYSVLYAVTVGSMALGPALAALLFVLHGNEWSAVQLKRICVAGLVRWNLCMSAIVIRSSVVTSSLHLLTTTCVDLR